MHHRCLALLLFLVHAISLLGAGWRSPDNPDVQVVNEPAGQWKVRSDEAGEFTLDSVQSYPAGTGDTFEVSLGIQVGLTTKALPELVCFDAEGQELPVVSSLATGPYFFPTDWRVLRRVVAARPGTARVRARVRASGQGDIWLSELTFRPVTVDPYETGMLVTQMYPGNVRGVVLESNLGIANPDRVTTADRDGDGKWAMIYVDLDELSVPEGEGADWRNQFQYRPNEVYWSDGAVLKSDSVDEDREPERSKALHFRMEVRNGLYRARLNDPVRAAAVSLDGQNWRRFEGGREAALGVVEARNGFIELWVDAAYRDPVTAGPVYFDYVRLQPVDDADAVEVLVEAAQQTPPALERGSVEEKRVRVTVEAPRFAEGPWPVRCGLPIPQGELVEANHAAVAGPGQAIVASQNQALAWWPDGSVKWLFLDFMHDFSRGGEAAYEVVYGRRIPPVPAQSDLTIVNTDEGLAVDTGAIRFLVSKQRFGLIERVRLGSGRIVQDAPLTAEIVEADGTTWRASDLPVETLRVEQAGPLHAVILVETKMPPSGQPATGFAHRARIHAYADSPLVQVDYFVAATDRRSQMAVRSIALKLDLASRITNVRHALGEASFAGSLIQPDADNILLRGGGREEKRAGSLPGWIAARLEGGGVLYAGLEAVREQFPKALRWGRDGLEISLWAAEGGDFEWYQGVGKTHHLSFYYGEGAGGDGALLAQGRVLALADPTWYCGSGAFGPIAPAAEGPLPAVEATLAQHMRERVIGQVGLGFENYGDHSSGGYVKGTFLWDNNEYDMPAAAFVHFARTGDREALRLGLASALHYLDVDIIHYSRLHADWQRAQHTHSHGAFGHHTAQGPDVDHAGYTQGLILYSYLTGERAGITGAEGIADWVLRNLSPNRNVVAMERGLGHPLMTLNDVYEATGREEYLRGAARLVEWASRWEHPMRSGFLAPNTEAPAYYSDSPFSGGLATAGILQFNSWAKNPALDAMLERVGRRTLTDGWRPPAGIRHKGGTARGSANARHIASHLRLMAHLFDQTGDPLFLVVPRLSVVKGFGVDQRPFGTRSTGLVFNHLPRFLATLAENGNPEADEQLEVTGAPPSVVISRGHVDSVGVTVRNRGDTTVRGLRASCHSRVDFRVVPRSDAPLDLAPGQEATLWYDIEAPSRINLTSQANRLAYAHWSALYEREGRRHFAHTWAGIEIEK